MSPARWLRKLLGCVEEASASADVESRQLGARSQSGVGCVVDVVRREAGVEN